MKQTRDLVVRHKNAFIVALVVIVAVIAAVAMATYSSFTPQYYFTTEVYSVDSEETFDVAKGQVLKLKFIVEPPTEDLVIVIRQGTELQSGKIQTGYILKDCPRVEDGDVVRFKAPHSGCYVVGMRTRSGGRAHVRVEYSLSD